MIPRSPRLQAYLQLASLSSCHKWESARSCVRLDKCVAAIWAVRCQYSCRPWHIGSQNTNRMPPVTPGILNDLSCLPHVAAASGWTEVDTWPLIRGGWVCENGAECCHLISRGPCGITRGILSSSVLQSHSALHTRGNVRRIGTRPCLSYSTAIQIGQDIN